MLLIASFVVFHLLSEVAVRSKVMIHLAEQVKLVNADAVCILTSIPASADFNASSMASASATLTDPAAAKRSVAASHESACEYSSVNGSGE